MTASAPDHQQPPPPSAAEARRARWVLGIIAGGLVVAGVLYTGSMLLGLHGRSPLSADGPSGDSQLPSHPAATPAHAAAAGQAPSPAPAAQLAPERPAPIPAGK